MVDLMVFVVFFIFCLKDEKNVFQVGFKFEKEFVCYKNILKKIDNEKLKFGY